MQTSISTLPVAGQRSAWCGVTGHGSRVSRGSSSAKLSADTCMLICGMHQPPPHGNHVCCKGMAWAVRRYIHHGTAQALPFMHDERAHGRTRLPGTHALVAVCLDGQLRHGIVRGAARAAQQGAERRASERQGGRCQPGGERPYSGTKMRRTHTLHNGILVRRVRVRCGRRSARLPRFRTTEADAPRFAPCACGGGRLVGARR